MFLALRELRRAKLRFGLLAVAIGLLVFLILFQVAIRDGLITQFIGALRNQNAPVLVYGDQARTNVEGSQIRPEQAAAIAEVDGVERTGRIGEGTFTVSTPTSRERAAASGDPLDALVDAVIFGYDVDDTTTGAFPGGLGAPSTLVAGRLPVAPGEAVVSEDTGDADGFELGDVVRVEPDGAEIEIVGVARDLNYSVAPTLFVPWDTYEQARRTRNPDAVAVFPSLIAVAPADGVSAAELTTRIDAAVDGVQALTRAQAVDGSPGVANVRTSLDTVVNLLRFAVFLVVGLFMLIVTVQKLSALTLLKAIGATTGQLVRSLLLLALVLVLAGSVVGTTLFALTSGFAAGIGLGFDLAVVLPTIATVLVAALIGTVFSVLRIRRLQPVDATQTAGVLR